MKRTIHSAFVFAIGLTLLFTSIAFAHEHREVGEFEFEVGFLNEPAYVGQPNAVFLAVEEHRTKKPVEGLEKSLKVEVIVGGKTRLLELRPLFEKPGEYAADFVPTKAGAYIFRFIGAIGTLKVDEKFESGPGRFSDANEIAALQFPEKLPDLLNLAAQVQAARDAVSAAQTISYVGVALGALGTILGALSLMKRK